jgi:hypothetical protein
VLVDAQIPRARRDFSPSANAPANLNRGVGQTRVIVYTRHYKRAQMTTTLSVRIDNDIKDQLEALAKRARRSKSFLAAEAIAAEWRRPGSREAFDVQQILRPRTRLLVPNELGPADVVHHFPAVVAGDAWGGEIAGR